MATRKIMDINEGGVHLVCIKENGKQKPYRVYKLWGSFEACGYKNHRKLMGSFNSFVEVVDWLSRLGYIFWGI